MQSLLAPLTPLQLEFMTNREMVDFQKWFFSDFSLFANFTISCVTTGAQNANLV